MGTRLLATLGHLLGDVRFALRLFRRRPLFTLSVLGILATGLGATTAMFSLIVSIFVRPLPFVDPDELSLVWTVQPGVRRSGSSLPDFLDLKASATTFSGLAAIDFEHYSLASEGARPEYFSGIHVTGDFFTAFGIHALHGRLLGPDDDRVGGPKVAVISADLWRRRFAADPALIGRAISLNGEPHTVVGITPPGFVVAGLASSRADIWTPFAPARRDYERIASEDGRGSHFLTIVGRRKPGVTVAEAQRQVETIGKRLAADHPNSNTGVGFEAVDLREALVGGARTGLWILFGAVTLVFLIVCTNVANLLLVRASSRRSELATRVALGASPWRLASLLLTETVILFALGACGGTVLARVFVDRLAQILVPSAGSQTILVRVDGLAFGFALALAAVAGLVVGLVPALQAARIAPHTRLKESDARASIGRSVKLVRGALVVAQVSLACTLLVGTGIALRGFARLAATPLGLDPKNVATANIALSEAKYQDGAKVVGFYRELVARLAALPGVESASANTLLPMSGRRSEGSFEIEGRSPWRPGERPFLSQNRILPGYFRTLGIPIRRGRDFTEEDAPGSRRVMVISQATADRYFPGEDPIGRRIAWGDGEGVTFCDVVGIVGDVYRHDHAEPIGAESYIPLAQDPQELAASVVVRTARPQAVLAELPSIVASLDREQAVGDRRLLEERIDYVLRTQRFTTTVLAVFAVAALVLAAFGIFGLVSYTTSQRTREFGIRLALGSSPERVIAVVMKEGIRLLAAGLLLGIIGALFVGRAMVGQVTGAVAFDPLTTAVILAVLGVSGALASLLPALRAIRISPAIALRYE